MADCSDGMHDQADQKHEPVRPRRNANHSGRCLLQYKFGMWAPDIVEQRRDDDSHEAECSSALRVPSGLLSERAVRVTQT